MITTRCCFDRLHVHCRSPSTPRYVVGPRLLLCLPASRSTHRSALGKLVRSPKSRIDMCDTGLFYIHEVSGETDQSRGRFMTVSLLRATCLRCMKTFHASSRPELEVIDSGAILYCRSCGTRQALLNSRFDALVHGLRSR